MIKLSVYHSNNGVQYNLYRVTFDKSPVSSYNLLQFFPKFG